MDPRVPKIARKGKMNNPADSNIARRGFLRTLAGATVALPLQPPTAATVLAGVSVAATSISASAQAANPPPDGYQYFGIEEAAFIEAAVDTLCPPVPLAHS